MRRTELRAERRSVRGRAWQRAGLLALLIGTLAGCGGPAEPPATSPTTQAAAQPASDQGADDDELLVNVGTSSYEVAGVPVIHKRTPGNEIVDVRLFVAGGAARWTEETAGAEQLALTVATRGGPEGMTKTSYAQQLDGMGSSIWAEAGPDYATIGLSSVRAYLEPTWQLLANVLASPAFTQSEIELRREQQLASVRTRLDNPDSAVVEVARELAFAGHPYRLRSDGTVETVEAFSREDLVAAFDALRDKSKLLVVVVGNVDETLVRRWVEETVGDFGASGEPIGEVAPLSYDEATVNVLARPDLPTNYILGYFDLPRPGDAGYAATQIALEILSDRLFEEVRTKRNLSYAVAAGSGTRRANIGYLYVTATDPATTIQVMFDTIATLESEGVTEHDLRNQVQSYLTSLYMDLQTNGAQAELLGRWELVAGDRMAAERHLEQLSNVTPEDVSDALRRFVADIQFGVVGDPDAIPTELFTTR